MRLDKFIKVKEIMDKMVAELRKHQEEEYSNGNSAKGTLMTLRIMLGLMRTPTRISMTNIIMNYVIGT